MVALVIPFPRLEQEENVITMTIPSPLLETQEMVAMVIPLPLLDKGGDGDLLEKRGRVSEVMTTPFFPEVGGGSRAMSTLLSEEGECLRSWQWDSLE